MGSLNTGYGLIATLVRDGDVTVRHFDVEPEATRQRRGDIAPAAGTRVAVRALVAFCDQGGWLVRTISTPVTILRDLQGIREQRDTEGRAIPGETPEMLLLHERQDLLEKRPVRRRVERDAPGRKRKARHA